MKKIIAGIIVGALLMTGTVFAANVFNFQQSQDIVYIDGQRIDTSNPSIGTMFLETTTNRNYVPLRLLSESMGCTVEWKQNTPNEIKIKTNKVIVDGVTLGKVTSVSGKMAHIIVNGRGYTLYPFGDKINVSTGKYYVVRSIGHNTMTIINSEGREETLLSAGDIR
jgi:hypothetical protein